MALGEVRVSGQQDDSPDALIRQRIGPKLPDVCGGAARIRNTRFPVWLLVEYRQLGSSDAEILEQHPDLTQDDLNAASAYYETNRQEIDEAMRANEEA